MAPLDFWSHVAAVKEFAPYRKATLEFAVALSQHARSGSRSTAPLLDLEQDILAMLRDLDTRRADEGGLHERAKAELSSVLADVRAAIPDLTPRSGD